MSSLVCVSVPAVVLTHQSDLNEKYHRWAAAWTGVSVEGRVILSSLQEVEISYFAAPGFKEFAAGKIVVMPTVAFMLYWYVEEDRRVKHQFNFVEAYEKGRSDGGKSGLFLNSHTKAFIASVNRTDIDPKMLLILKFAEEELWLKFHSETVSQLWQTAFSALLKAYFQSLDAPVPNREIPELIDNFPVQSQKCALLRTTLGLLFDISTCQKPDERNFYPVWTTMKVTYLQVGSETQEEYYVFDRSQTALEPLCEDILERVREKLDPGNLAILALYLKEISVLEYEKRKRTEGHIEQGWVCRGLGKPEMMALWLSDFTYVMQQYRKGDVNALKLAISSKCTEITQCTNSPIEHFFGTASAFCMSTKLQLTVLSQLHRKSVNAEETNASIASLQAKLGAKSGPKWYKESCDCRLF